MRKTDGSSPSGSTMNILFLCRLFYPHIGGVEKHVLEISKILIKKGHKIVVVTEKHQNKLMPKEKIEGIEVYRIPDLRENWFKKFKIWKWMWENRRLIKQADIIHCHDVFFWYFPFRFLFFKKPIYTTFHGYESYPLRNRQIVMHRISNWLSFGNICVGDFIGKWYGTKPDYVTYGAVEISNFSPRGEAGKFKISNRVRNKSAIFIGRLDEQTGIKTYANAVKLIRNKIPDFDFMVVGDGKFGEEIKKEFKVLGFKKNPKKYLLECRFAFASRYLSILEAMAVKKLVFAVYDNPLKEDYLKMAPFSKLINIVRSENKIVDKILYFLKNPKEEEEMIRNAFEWTKTKTWENAATPYLLLWKKSLN